MKVGAAHVRGLYTYPAGSGTQFTDGGNKIAALGFNSFKFYCTQAYAADYPLHTWGSAPVNCTQLLQDAAVAAQLARAEFTDYAITIFAFGNPNTNWWRDAGHADNTRLATEYTEIYNAAVHLLTTYNDTGKTFVFQNWEGDWALMDVAGVPDTYVKRRDMDYCLAFHSARQRAVRDAMRATAHKNVAVMYAVEVNRVVDVWTNPGYARLLKDVLNRLEPDVVSYSAYDSTISTYGASQTEWGSTMTTLFTRALQTIQEMAPKSYIQIGEYGFEEERIAIDRPSYDAGEMAAAVAQIALDNGVRWLYYWEVFDNEADGTTPTGVKGYWITRPDGTTSLAATALQAFI